MKNMKHTATLFTLLTLLPATSFAANHPDCGNADNRKIPECCTPSGLDVFDDDPNYDCVADHNAKIANRDNQKQLENESKALLPKLKTLNDYTLLIPAATAYINDVKSLTSNYLIDNTSVSSIPRNSRALIDRHLAWLQAVGAKVDAGKSSLDTVVDVISYNVSLQSIASFERSCQDDQALASAEVRFVGDLSSVQQAIQLLKARSGSISSSLGDAKFEELGDHELVSNVNYVSGDLDRYSDSINAIKGQIMAQDSKRRLICQEIPKAWRDMADNKLRQVNAQQAEALIKEINAALRGPEVYALVASTASRALAGVDQRLNQYSPVHAQRAFLAASAVVKDLRATLAAASITEDMRAQGNVAVDDYQRKLASRQASVKDQMTRKTALAKERQRQTRLISNRLAQAFTAECTTLSQKILSPTLVADSAQSEDLFIEFKTNCQSH